jgi:hypothetical protein
VNPATILLIMQGIQLLGTVVPTSLDAFLKIKSILQTDGTDFDVQVRVLQDGELLDIDAGDAIIAAWIAAHPA